MGAGQGAPRRGDTGIGDDAGADPVPLDGVVVLPDRALQSPHESRVVVPDVQHNARADVADGHVRSKRLERMGVAVRRVFELPINHEGRMRPATLRGYRLASNIGLWALRWYVATHDLRPIIADVPRLKDGSAVVRCR